MASAIQKLFHPNLFLFGYYYNIFDNCKYMPEGKKIKILYVDDEESNLFIFKVNFERKYPVITAISGEEGLEKLSDHPDEIIVVISDMRMPSMNGVEFIRKARETHDNIFYYILTGYDFNEDIEEALKAGEIQKFFKKPFDIQEIEGAILQAIDEIDN